MKILYVQDTDWIRRNPMQHNHLADRLALRGHEIRVIDYEILWRKEGKKQLYSKRQVLPGARLFENSGVTVIRPPIIKIPIIDYASMVYTYTKEVKRQIREFKPDVIVGDTILSCFLAYRVASKNHVPTVFYILDVNHRLIPFRFLQSLGKKLESSNIRNAHKVISICEGLREYTTLMGAKPQNTVVITAGTDLQRFNPDMDGKPVRKQYGIKDDDFVLFFVGWLHHSNGLIEVVTELAKTEDEKLKLLIVGDGDAYNELLKMKDNLNLHDRLILTGRKPYDEVPSFIAAGDICLFPSHTDEPIMQYIVPIKMYDYLAAGKPIISTTLPGITKQFGDHSGIVYIDGPEDAIAKAMKLRQNGSLAQVGSEARHFAQTCTWDKITDDFEKVLWGLTKERT
ncbi:MAG: glycosyltransferase family 4 protein [Chloroflexi bacterium]|nr:glycosyltransferase family 4 protein [Chloroflexota bacterium]